MLHCLRIIPICANMAVKLHGRAINTHGKAKRTGCETVIPPSRIHYEPGTAAAPACVDGAFARPSNKGVDE